MLVLFSQSELDSLSTALKSSSGNKKVDILLNIAQKHFEINNSEAKKICNEALSLSLQLNYTGGIINSNYLLGKILFDEKNFSSA